MQQPKGVERAIERAIEGGYIYKGGPFISNPAKSYIEGGFIIQKGHQTADGWDGGTARHRISDILFSELFLDPLFWKALGKAEGWGESKEIAYREKTIKRAVGEKIVSETLPLKSFKIIAGWKLVWHRFIDHIIEGKTADDFFNSLLK